MAEQFILYACPTGELATQLDTYFARSEALCGRNAAHNYMPHCTLTGFFWDEESAVEGYGEAIAKALTLQLAADPQPQIAIQGITFRPDWHGLELQSSWLSSLMARVAHHALSPTRQGPLRIKSWLHLSLAYEFPPEQAATLQQLAQDYVNPHTDAGWEIRFYQRHPDYRWTCHYTWPLITAANPSNLKL